MTNKPQGHPTATEARKKPPVSPPGGISISTGGHSPPVLQVKPIFEKDRIIPRIDPDLTDYEKECRVETDGLRECLTDYATIYDGCDKCRPGDDHV